ncbi:MAG: glucose 1-dehydrogenase [Cyanobacteria bacterium J06635_15]
MPFSRRNIIASGAAGLATALSAQSIAKAAIGSEPPSDAATTVAQVPSEAADTTGSFAGKVVLITGATSGIGEITAKAFAKEGASVFFCGRRANLGAKVEQNIRAMGGEATYMRADVREADQVKAFVEGCVSKYGRIDIAFNNAGIDYPPATIAETSIEDFDDLMNTNARAVFVSMKYELPYLVETKGKIINNASIGGHRAFPNIVGYGASKAAVIHMTKMTAQEYGKHVRINAIAPGGVRTAMWERVQRDWNVTEEQLVQPYPMQRAAEPDEIAEAVMWLASDAASYVSGMRLDIDGGGLG